MRRYPAGLAAASLCALSLLAAPVAAHGSTTSGSYRVHVLPDPTQGHSPYGICGAAEAMVLGIDIGDNARRVSVPAGRTLKVQLVPDLNAFAGDVGLQWSVRILDSHLTELARSAGPAWRTEVSHLFSSGQQAWIVACNRNGFPEATVSYSLR